MAMKVGERSMSDELTISKRNATTAATKVKTIALRIGCIAG
jgi:hypothetical protein